MSIKDFIEERRKKEDGKCQKLREDIKVLLDENFEDRGEILGIIMEYYNIRKTSPKFKKFIICFNKIMDELNESESEW